MSFIGWPSAGTASAVDAVARALAQAVTGEPGEPVASGEERLIGGHLYTNPTAATINIPGTTTPAAVIAAGFAEINTTAGELYDTVQTAANVTHTALARGVKIFTATGAKIARLPTGIAVGQERRFIRNGPNNADIFIADGTAEIIYTRNVTTGALENAADGGVRLNRSEGWVLLKKISATAWEVYDRPDMLSGTAAAAPVVPPVSADFLPTTAAQVLAIGGRYKIGLHTVGLSDLGQGAQFWAIPSDGTWANAARIFDVPAGWTIVSMSTEPQGGRLAVFECDTANSRYLIHS